MLLAIPLLIIPFALYNLAMAGLFGDGGVAVLDSEVMAVNMLSGTTWTMAFGDLLIFIALVLLFVEILKATRPGSRALLDHMLSMVLFVVFLVEFLLVQGAAHPVFFVLMVIALIDVLAGFSVSLRSAGRDVTFN